MRKPRPVTALATRMHLGAGGLRRTATRTRMPALVVAALAVAAVLPVARASSASATEYNINTWEDGWVCSNYDSQASACLWYSPDLEGAFWGTESSFVDLDTATPTPVFNNTDYNGSSGHGDKVANDAASMADGTTFCTVDTYVYGDGTGNYDHLSAGWAGNLTDPGLRNNEGSIAYYC
jgi:hypothetical protein